MKLATIVFCFLLSTQTAAGQSITYSPANVASNTAYLVVGKVQGNFMVFTSTGWRKRLLVFDANMKELSHSLQRYMPDDILSITPIPTREHVIVTYRYAKKNILYCDAVKLNAYGKKISEVIRIDSMVLPMAESYTTGRRSPSNYDFMVNDEVFTNPTAISTGGTPWRPMLLFGENISEKRPKDDFFIRYSEDKSKLLIYRTEYSGIGYYLEAKIWNADLQLLDVVKISRAFTEENYTTLQIDNEGNIFFLAETAAASDGSINKLQLVSKRYRVNNYITVPVDLGAHVLLRPHFKVDNINKNIVVNAFYIDPSKGNRFDGIFSLKLSTKLEKMRSVFTAFPPALSSLRYQLMSGKPGVQGPFGFLDFFFILDLYFTKEGSYQLVAARTSKTQGFSMDSINTSTPQVVFVNVDSSLQVIDVKIFNLKQMLENPRLIRSYSYLLLNRGSSLDLMVSTENVNGVAATNKFNIHNRGVNYKYAAFRYREPQLTLKLENVEQVSLDQLLVPFSNARNSMGFALIQLQD